MSQAPDGILWIGSTGGLFTFDGLKFLLFHPAEDSPPLPNKAIRWLLAARNGDIWVFFVQGPPARIRDSRVVVFGGSEEMPINKASSPQEDSKGVIWALLNDQVPVTLGSDGIWHKHAAPPGTVNRLFVDSLDTIWLVANDRLYRMSANDSHFSKTELFVYGKKENPAVHGALSMAESPSHDIWIAASSPGVPSPAVHPLQHVNQAGKILPSPEVDFTYGGLVFAPDGSLWVDTTGYLLHITSESLRKSEKIRLRQQDRALLPIAGDGAYFRGFLQARDGSIWTAGFGGLERFAPATIVQATPGAPIGFQRSCPSSDGGFWYTDRLVGTLFYKRPGKSPQTFPLSGIHGFVCSQQGLVVITRRGLSVVSHHRIKHLPSLPGLGYSTNRGDITGAVLAPDQSVYASGTVDSKGPFLWHFDRNRWSQLQLPPNETAVTAFKAREDGSVLIGFQASPPLILHAGKMTSTHMASPGIGEIDGFAETTYGLFAYGRLGIALQVGDTFMPLPLTQPEYALQTSGLTEDLHGSLWLNADRGIVWIQGESILRYLRRTATTLASVNIQEGSFIGPAIRASFMSTAQLDSLGKVVFGTMDGVVIVDPDHLNMPAPPLLSIRRIAANGIALTPDKVFQPDVVRLIISYVGVEYFRPREVLYRYRLVGLDHDWQHVGTTEAMYTNVGPGRYRFEVQARNAYGQWSGVVSSDFFTIAPHYFQTLWFKALLGVLLVCTIALLMRIRMQSIAADIQSKANERADERIVIARDLHDTLLQGVQGLLLAFHAAADRVPEEHESKPSLERALATADRLILEGRRTVKRLRSSVPPNGDLRPALEALGRHLGDRGEIKFSVLAEELQRPLAKEVAVQIVLIATEAVRNAIRHAQPTKINIVLQSSKRHLVLSCSDDGGGFAVDPAEFRNGSNDELEHWGVRGMYERAARIGGTLAITKGASGGTVVRLTLPKRRAYL